MWSFTFWEIIIFQVSTEFSTSSFRSHGTYPRLLHYTHALFPCGHVTRLVSLRISDLVVKLPHVLTKEESVTDLIFLNIELVASCFFFFFFWGRERKVCLSSLVANSTHSPLSQLQWIEMLIDLQRVLTILYYYNAYSQQWYIAPRVCTLVLSLKIALHRLLQCCEVQSGFGPHQQYY